MEPLVPSDVDLRGMPFMPLDVSRLRDSQLAIRASGDEFRAAVLLWCASWAQIPASSLPDDDVDLAYLAGFGKDVKGWKRIKSGAMRGFVLCDDGLFYHPVIAEKAMEAWENRKDYRANKANGNERKKQERAWRSAAFAALKAVGVVPAYDTKTFEIRRLVEEKGLTVIVTDGTNVTNVVTPPVTVTGHAPDTAKTGTGTGTGTGIKIEKQSAQGAQSPNEPGLPPAGRRAQKISITAWLDELETRGEDAVPVADPIFEWAGNAGIPDDFLALSWCVFRDDKIASGKPQKDWRQTYRNYVKKGFLHLWYFDKSSGECLLTTAGVHAHRQYNQEAA